MKTTERKNNFTEVFTPKHLAEKLINKLSDEIYLDNTKTFLDNSCGTGIYEIRNKINNKSYFGSAINFKQRWNRHITELKQNKHINKHLQNSFNKYGIDNFVFFIIEFVDEPQLENIEQEYLNIFWDNNKNCYNINPFANRPPGNKGGKPHSEQHKQKIREARMGQKRTQETKQKMRKKKLGKKRKPFSEEHKLKMRESQQKRRERELKK